MTILLNCYSSLIIHALPVSSKLRESELSTSSLDSFTWLLPQTFNVTFSLQVQHRFLILQGHNHFITAGRHLSSNYVTICTDGADVVGRTIGNAVWSRGMAPNWTNGHRFFMIPCIVHKVSFSIMAYSREEKIMNCIKIQPQFFFFIYMLVSFMSTWS